MSRKIYFLEEKINKEGKGGKFLEKEDTFMRRRRKTEKKSREKMEKKKRKLSWRGKNCCAGVDGN